MSGIIGTVGSRSGTILQTPMMLATGANSTNQALTQSLATLTIFDAGRTGCFIRGITLSSGVATVPIAGKYFISLNAYFSGLTDQDFISFLFVFSAHADRQMKSTAGGSLSSLSASGIFEMNAGETCNVDVVNYTRAAGAVDNAETVLHWSILYIRE